MNFKKVSDQENATSGASANGGTPNPWYRFAKGANGYVDREGPAVKFRFLQELRDMIISRTHWDDDLRKPVACARVFERSKKDNKLWPKGECKYCAIRKEYKDAFEPTKEKQYCDKKWAMKAVLVAPVAVLIPLTDEKGKPELDEEGEQVYVQKFYFMPLNVLDMFYPAAKGFYKMLQNFTNSKKSLLKHWYELTPNDFLTLDLPLTKEDQRGEVVGLEDIDSQVENAAPFPYDEAMKLREKLTETNKAESYEEALEEAETEKVEEPKASKKAPANKKPQPKQEEVNEECEDDIPPF